MVSIFASSFTTERSAVDIGYTHYWRRKKEISQDNMDKIVKDFNTIKPELDKHIDLADGSGDNSPIISNAAIIFNGREKCGHQKDDLGITWPAKGAGGVAQPYKDEADGGHWFAGKLLSMRRCGGDCSHETFMFERIMKLREWDKPDENDLHFEFCKTAYKPYDLAVITCLIIAKQYLGEDIKISSDGEDEQWWDGKYICQVLLGYGLEYAIDSKEGRLVKSV